MRVMPIRVFSGSSGWKQLKASYAQNHRHYLQEALGLAVFMISACFFSALLYSENGFLFHRIESKLSKDIFMGMMMGGTALFIFYSPWTAPSGSQINPAVTLTFWRLGKMCPYDALFFMIYQFAGGILAVYIMQWLMGPVLVAAPVNSAVTIPGKLGTGGALIMELLIAFITMTMVLFTSANEKLKKYTRIFAGCLVCTWVIVAGPISGFGMNPARSFASALPAQIWTSFWIYFIMPVTGMLSAAEFFLFVQKRKRMAQKTVTVQAKRKPYFEPLEFVL